MIKKQEKSIEIFSCYAHKDKKLRDELEKHLNFLQHQGFHIKWNEREVSALREWAHVFDQHILTAHIILLLISPDFMSTDYLHSPDMDLAFQRQQTEETYIIPILLRPVNYSNTPIEPLKFLPHNSKPITRWGNRDEAFFDVSQGIKNVIKQIKITNESIDSSNDPNFQGAGKKTSYGDISSSAYPPEIIILNNISEANIASEVASPTMDRASRLLGQIDENTEKTKRDKSKIKKPKRDAYYQMNFPNTEGTNESPSHLIKQQPLFNEFSSTELGVQTSKTNLIPDYEDLRRQAQRIADERPQKALNILEDIDIGSAPSKQRWRLAALRGIATSASVNSFPPDAIMPTLFRKNLL